MKQVTRTEMEQMSVLELEAALPFELTENGDVLGVMKSQDIEIGTVKTKCPNCGLVYQAKKPDGKPSYFTIRHPQTEPEELEETDDTAKEPQELRRGEYHCPKCGTPHRESSKVGAKHLKHKLTSRNSISYM